MRNKGIKSDRRRWRLAEARGRKMDEMRERESCAPERERERERELRVKYREERKKIVKKLYTHATVL